MTKCFAKQSFVITKRYLALIKTIILKFLDQKKNTFFWSK